MPPLRIVALGDSVPRGFLLGVPHRTPPSLPALPWSLATRWFDHPARGYPAQVAATMSRPGRPVVLVASTTGSSVSTAQLWDGRPAEAVRDAVTPGTDIATITVGINDVLTPWLPYVGTAIAARRLIGPTRIPYQWGLSLLAPSPTLLEPLFEGMQTRLRGLVMWLAERDVGRIVVTTYYCPDGSQVVRERLTQPMNAAIRTAVRGIPQVRVAELEGLFEGHDCNVEGPRRWISDRDGMHPTDAGQRAIAAAVVAAIHAA